MAPKWRRREYIPLKAGLGGGCGIVNLGEVGHDGALVRRGNRVVGVAGELGAADDVLVPGTDPVTGLDLDDSVRRRPRLAADHVLAADILDRVVVVGSAEAGEGALVRSVDGDLLEDAVTLDGEGSSQDGEE